MLSASTIANILKRHGIEPAPERARKTTWKEFIFRHFDPIVATDFFTVEAWKKRGLQRFVVLFFIDLSSRRVELGGIAKSPSGLWMEQVGRNITDGEAGILKAKRYLIHDRDRLYTAQFRAILKDSRMESVKLSRRSPNLNAFAEGLVRSIIGVLGRYHSFRRRALRTAVREYLAHDLGDNEFGRCLGRAVGANRCRRDRITGAVRFGVEWGSRYGDVTLGRLGPSIFTAIQEQMGLRLESARGPLEVLVVDSVSKPSEN